MNKTAKIAVIAAFALATSAYAWPWTLDNDGGQVPSGGYWFTYGDENESGSDGEGGCSSTNFPPGSETEDVVTGAWKDLGGIITYTFNDNCTYKYRFAGFGFNWFDGGSTKLTISDEEDPTGGANAISIKYSLSADAGVNCVVEIASDGVTAYNNYTSTMQKGNNQSEVYPFSGFKQATGWGTTVTWPVAWQASEGVKFKCEAGDPSNGNKTASLKIDEIGFQGGTPILKSGSVPGLKMVQNGRIFSLSMERAASVQVINLQGAVVYTQTITNRTMNLSHLPTGVYMVRIPSLGYTNKVILK